MLASSKGIGDFINKQEYRSVTRDQLASTITQIKELKAKLDTQKEEVEGVLRDQEDQRNQLAAKEAEQRNLLSETQGNEDAYRNLSSSTNARKEQLQKEQQAAIQRALAAAGGGGSKAVAGDPNKGGYPDILANSEYYNPIIDRWGMYSRQCVSYTAWKVEQKNGSMPYWGGRGNANQWPGNARAAGIPVSTTPRAGSVGVIMAGQYGHVVWVESVNGDGTVNISQYNFLNAGGSGWGHYSEMYNVPAASYDYYIYF
jgi:surface antigen